MIDWNLLESEFGDWSPKLKPFWEKGGFEPIFNHLKTERARSQSIAPLGKDVFKALQATSYQNLKLVICGMCPYHSLKESRIIADGLMMGCSKTSKLQPSLQNFYDAIEREIYDELCLSCDKPNDVSYLASQGILMWNVALTTSIGKAGNHIELWKDFNKFFFSEVIANSGVPCLFLGKEAGKSAKFLAPFQWNWIISHPASVSYSGQSEWDSKGVFKEISKVLLDNNKEKIMWLPNEKEENEIIPF